VANFCGDNLKAVEFMIAKSPLIGLDMGDNVSLGTATQYWCERWLEASITALVLARKEGTRLRPDSRGVSRPVPKMLG